MVTVHPAQGVADADLQGRQAGNPARRSPERDILTRRRVVPDISAFKTLQLANVLKNHCSISCQT